MIKKYEGSKLRDLFPIAELFFAASGAKGKLDPEHWFRSWDALINIGFGKILVAEDSEGVPWGIIGGTVAPDLNTGGKVATESFWFARPEAPVRTGLRLLEAFESWAKEAGAARIIMGALVNHRLDSLTKLYRRRGYRSLEVYYEKNLL